MEGLQLQGHVTFWLCGHVTSEKKIYLNFHNTYGYQIGQSGNLRSEGPAD